MRVRELMDLLMNYNSDDELEIEVHAGAEPAPL